MGFNIGLFIYRDMSFTRFHDDSARIEKRLQMGTIVGRYALGTPGPGEALPFIGDPHMRLQYWAGNFMENGVGIEDDLRGLTRRAAGHDSSQYDKHAAYTTKKSFPINETVLVEESRAVVPAFTFREANMYRFDYLHLDPQANLEVPFNYNMNTDILVKDRWRMDRTK
jgi:hypothetical protein